MKVSTKGRYALRLMVDLAEHNTGEYISLKDIFGRQQISIKYLEQIVSQLCKADMVISTRGAQGGYKLARLPKEYTAGEILRVTEGNLAPVVCVAHEVNPCEMSEICPTVDFWLGLNKVVNDYVDSVTIEEMANAHIKKMGNSYVI